MYVPIHVHMHAIRKYALDIYFACKS